MSVAAVSTMRRISRVKRPDSEQLSSAGMVQQESDAFGAGVRPGRGGRPTQQQNDGAATSHDPPNGMGGLGEI